MNEAERPRGPFDFNAPYFWSLLKLEILEKYTDALARIVGSRWPICFVDLMAGEGMYDTGDRGSAARLLEIARKNREAGRRLRLIAVEADEAAYAQLEQNLAGAEEFVQARHGRWEDQIDDLLRETAGEFVFFFIDPMGVREIPWAQVNRLLRRPNSEALINLNTQVSARLAGNVRNGSSHAAGARERLNALVGDNSWEAGLPAVERGELPRHIASAYVNRIHALGYSVSSTLISERGDVGRPKYHLVFASRAFKAFEVMNNILHLQRERLRQDRTLAQQPPLLAATPAEYQREREAELVGTLAQALATDPDLRGKSMAVENLHRTVLPKHFAEFKEAHYARAATILLNEDRITAPDAKWVKRLGQTFLQKSVVVTFPQ